MTNDKEKSGRLFPLNLEPCTARSEGPQRDHCSKWDIALPRSGHWCRLCQTRPGYVRLWESGHGPGPGQPAGTSLPLHDSRRSEEDQALCKGLCADCDLLGQADHAPFCGLDLPAVNREKLAGISDCAKRSLQTRYQARLRHRGADCEAWKAALARSSQSPIPNP